MTIREVHLLFLLMRAMYTPPIPPLSSYGKDILRSLDPIYTPHNRGKLTLEHVVPRSLILTNRSRIRREALHDMHNLFSTSRYLNGARGNMRFDEPSLLPPGRLLYVGHGNYIDRLRNTFCPAPEYRGVVARASLHMSKTWGCPPQEIAVGGEETLWRWNAEHPPSEMEMLHNYLVFEMQHTINHFISNETRPLPYTPLD